MQTVVLTLTLGVVLTAAPPQRKFDPEPPRRTPVGEWAGMWDDAPVDMSFSRNGLFHEMHEDAAFSGRWKRADASPLRIIINEWTVPGREDRGCASYHLHLSRDGRRLRSSPNVWLCRVR
jgi:hypothetical protein